MRAQDDIDISRTSDRTPLPRDPVVFVIDADTVRADDWHEAISPLLSSWLDQHFDEMPPTENDDPIGSLPIFQDILGRVMSHGIGFGHELLLDRERFATYSHGQFLLQLRDLVDHKLNRIAVVGMGERTRYQTRHHGGRRYDGAIGVQVTAAGSPKLKAEEGESQLLLRIMPFGLDWERANAGFYRQKKDQDPHVAIALKPTFEAEALSKQGVMTPGARIVLQPGVGEPGESRVLAEIYLKFEIPKRFDEFKEISIVPRCMVDQSLGRHRPSANPQYGERFNDTYDKLHSVRICSINVQFKLAK